MPEKLTYESGIEELEKIVSQIESGNMPLTESIKAFERGVKLTTQLKKLLNEGDAKIRELTAAQEIDITGEVKNENA